MSVKHVVMKMIIFNVNNGSDLTIRPVINGTKKYDKNYARLRLQF